MLILEKNRVHWANQFLNEILRMMQGILISQNKIYTIQKRQMWMPRGEVSGKKRNRNSPEMSMPKQPKMNRY